MDKIEVNGSGTCDLYKFLKAEKKGIMGTESIKWNFTKFLVDTEGNVIKRYASTATYKPIEKDLLKLLK